MKKYIILVFVLSLSSVNLFSQDIKKQPILRLLLSGALELGGDEIAKIYFTNGEDQLVRAGQGGSVAIGGQLQFPKESRLLLRSTVGIKYVTTQADNAHIRLTRIPLHFTANWQASPKIRLGIGWVTHQNIRFKTDGIGQNLSFKGANGPTFEIAYSNFGLSYTMMKYKAQDNIPYSANAVGLTISGIIENFGTKKRS